MVNLLRQDLVDDLLDGAAIRQITVMEVEARAFAMRILIDGADSSGVEGGGAADDAVDLVTLAQQKFREVGAILAGDSGDECPFRLFRD